MSEPLSPAMVELMLEHRLGPHRLTLQPGRPIRVLVATGMLSAVALFMAFLFYDGTTGGQIAGLILVLLGTVPFGWVLLASPIVSAKARARVFHVFEHGYVQVTRRGPVPRRWDEVRTVFQTIVTQGYYGVGKSTVYCYDLTFADGTKTSLTTYVTDMATLGPIIQEQVAKAQLPKAIAHLQGGGTITFGDLQVDQHGVSSRKGHVPWSEIKAVVAHNGYLNIKRDGKLLPFSTVKISEIANFYTFVCLVDSGLGQKLL